MRRGCSGKPWFFLYNIPDTHRPYPNSDRVRICVKPGEVKLPAFLPDTPVVRKDWAEYLAGIERADALIGEAMTMLREARDNWPEPSSFLWAITAPPSSTAR